ncbi:MAG: hypothetical protein IJ346_05435 [Clostridia bacterium]|nr:hypothetical protein [Clostridia bacterium]
MSDVLAEKKSPKTKRKLNKGILLLLILTGAVLVSGVVIGASFALPKSISGSWELVVNPEVPSATADEIPDADKAYYVFEKPDRYGRGEYRTCYQGGVEHFGYELLKEGSVNKINLGSEDMEYKITGSKLLGCAELTIIFPEYTDESTGVSVEAQEYVFEQAQDPDYKNQAYKDYEADPALIGEKWASNERSLAYYYYSFPYTQTIEFLSEGVMVIRYESAELALDRYMYYSYTTNGSELTFSLVTDSEPKYTVAYELDADGNLTFINDTTKNSIFADAFFGEYTFYTPKNLPEATEASGNNSYFAE